MEQGTIEEFQIMSTGDGPVRAFAPHPCRPTRLSRWTTRSTEPLPRVMLALGRLDGISSLLPDLDGFLYAYTHKEVVLSSQIDVRQSSLSDLILYETEEMHGTSIDDVMRVFKHTEVIKKRPVSLEAHTFKIYNLKKRSKNDTRNS